MFRPLAAAAAFATLVLAGTASAQTYGQPVYLNAWGRPVGGTSLSEVETRSYVETGRWADGYSDRPQVYVPAPGYGRPYVSYGSGYRHPEYRSYRSEGGYRYGYGGGYRHDGRRHHPPRRPGYRDEWGYQDDRPPAWRGRNDRGYRYRDDHGCGCADVYFYDR
jgi:hypothetical protein